MAITQVTDQPRTPNHQAGKAAIKQLSHTAVRIKDMEAEVTR